jgi:hypothetical protein
LKLAKMAKMGLFSRLTTPKQTLPIVDKEVVVFDKKYTTVVDFPSTADDIEKILWVHSHAYRKSVDMQVVNGKVYMAFEDDSDALIFRIKFL